MDGKGIYYYPNGQKYEGEWKNGQRNGKGIMYFPDGEEKKQYWKDGKRDFIRQKQN